MLISVRYWGHQHAYATQMMSIRDGAILPRVVDATKEKKVSRKKLKKLKEKAGKGEEEVKAANAKEPSSSRSQSPSSGIEKLSLKGKSSSCSRRTANEIFQQRMKQRRKQNKATMINHMMRMEKAQQRILLQLISPTGNSRSGGRMLD